MHNLRTVVERLALEFARDLVRAIRNAKVADIRHGTDGGSAVLVSVAAPAKVRAGRGRARRTSDDIGRTADAIVALLKKHQSGLRSEQIQKKLRIARAALPRPIGDALKAKRIVKTGEKRATTYFAR